MPGAYRPFNPSAPGTIGDVTPAAISGTTFNGKTLVVGAGAIVTTADVATVTRVMLAGSLASASTVSLIRAFW